MKKTKTIILEQLSIFGESQYQNYYTSPIWGTLVFFISNNTRKVKDCQHCLLWNGGEPDECPNAPCTPTERIDGHNGFYSIRQIPRSKPQ